MSAHQKEGAEQVKMDFPLVKTISRDKLIHWFRETLSPKLHTIKELGTGADFCRGLEMIFPGCIGRQRIKFNNPSIYDRRQHFKLIQSAFNSLNLNKDFPIEKLEKGNYGETYYFALWFKAFFEANYKGTAKDLRRFQSSVYPIKNNMVWATAGGFRQIAGSLRPKYIEVKSTIEVQNSANSEKGPSSEMKGSSPRRKKKRLIFPLTIINPRMATCSRMKQEIPKSNIMCNETLRQKQIKVLTQQKEELEKAVKDLIERKQLMEDDNEYFEKRTENLEELKLNQDPEPKETKDPLDSPVTFKHFEDLGDIKEEDEKEAKSFETVDLKKVDLEIQIDQIYQVVKEQRTVIGELKQQKESKDEQIATLQRFASEQTDTIKELETVMQNQDNQIKELQEMPRLHQLEETISQQLKHLEQLSQTNEGQIKQIEEFEQIHNGQHLNNTVLTKSNEAMAGHIEVLEHNYKDLMKQNDNLIKYNKELARYYSDLSNESKELYQRNHRLAKNYETVLCYSCIDANLYFKQLLRIEKACKKESNSSLCKCINDILNQTRYYPPLNHGPAAKQ